jgi:hypothetical protein
MWEPDHGLLEAKLNYLPRRTSERGRDLRQGCHLVAEREAAGRSTLLARVFGSLIILFEGLRRDKSRRGNQSDEYQGNQQIVHCMHLPKKLFKQLARARQFLMAAGAT